jgi:peptidoglycan/LPS O-acetylase OafA/YrhL
MKGRIIPFDLLRGMAALLVMLGHVRSVTVLPFNALKDPGIFDKFFYFITGYGHECVIVFFVLSGYFVGGAFVKGLSNNNSNWIRNYSVSRLVRLWVVLIPVMIITLVLDSLGKYLTDLPVYENGNYFQYIKLSNDLSLQCFVGNMLFLQTILIPTFGTNGPLWSLAYEFWYYLMFPLLALSLFSNYSAAKKIHLFLAALLICIFLQVTNPDILSGFLIWLLGCGVVVVAPTFRSHSGVTIVLVMIFFLGFIYVRMYNNTYEDYILSGCTVLLLLGIFPLKFNSISRISIALANISYTLYLVHLPIVIFIKAVFLSDQLIGNDTGGYLLFTFLVIIILLVSYFVYWIFERNTERIKMRLAQFNHTWVANR